MRFLLLLIPLLPLAGFLINAALGRRLPKSVSGLLATGVMAASFGVSVVAVFRMLNTEPVGGVRAIDEVVYTWLASGALQVPLAFRLDPLSAVMILAYILMALTEEEWLKRLYGSPYREYCQQTARFLDVQELIALAERKKPSSQTG